MWAKYASGDSLWCSTAPMPPPNGILITIGIFSRPRGAEVHLRHLADDLVEGRVDEAVELDLADRPVAAHRHPDRGADDAGLGQRGVDHPVLAEVLLQALGDPEDPAELADVLAGEDDLRVGLQGAAQAGVERLGQGDLVVMLRHPRWSHHCLPHGVVAGRRWPGTRRTGLLLDQVRASARRRPSRTARPAPGPAAPGSAGADRRRARRPPPRRRRRTSSSASPPRVR